MNFPQYRKYKNDLSFFKIINENHFIEWKKQAKQWEKTDFKATILPDHVFISDMLQEESEYWVPISEEDFNQFLQSI